MKMIHGGGTAPFGFTANGVYCGIKRSKRRDLALIYSKCPSVAAGVFTTNNIQASCVVLNKEQLKDQTAQVIVANSGNANCMTGKSGFQNSKAMITRTARCFPGVSPKNVLIASTGVIGKPLPIKKILNAIPDLAKGLGKDRSPYAAAAILTTDRFNKEIAVEIKIGGKPVRLGAIAKGAGMIHPRMTATGTKHATMLCFVTTDAVIAHAALKDALVRATDKTFNTITIDGDVSTNDMVLVLANGMAENEKIVERSKEFKVFSKTLEAIFLKLAKGMIRDAEGATKFVEVVVKHAATDQDAKKAAEAVASSNLVKCALFGCDPNWGRIAAAVGYSGAYVDPWKMQIYLGKELVLQNGGKVKKKAAVLNRVFAKKNIKITVDLKIGRHNATAFTCDLSTEYVRINSYYRT